MIILDTDVLSHIQKNDYLGGLIQLRLDASPDPDIRTTSVNSYEMLNGAVALIERRKKERGDLPSSFRLLDDTLEFIGLWTGLILPYDTKADRIYRGFTPRLRQELKDDARIASIALANDAVVWTCNVTDYARVPGLSVFDAKTGLKV